MILSAFLSLLIFNAASLEAGIINPNIDYLEIIGTDRSRSIRRHYYGRGARALHTALSSFHALALGGVPGGGAGPGLQPAHSPHTWRHIQNMFHSRVAPNTLPYPDGLVRVRSVLAVLQSIRIPNY